MQFTFMLGFSPAVERQQDISRPSKTEEPTVNWEAAHRESSGCKCWEMTAALWSAGQRVPEPGGDQGMNPGLI